MSFRNLDTLYRQVIMDHYRNPRNKGILTEGSFSVNMNNPTCGDRIQLTLTIEDELVKDARFDGEGCSISMASASMMTQLIIGKPVEEALHLSEIFSEMMQGNAYEGDIDLGDLEALSGVAKFPARIRCATLAWKAMEKGVNENE